MNFICVNWIKSVHLQPDKKEEIKEIIHYNCSAISIGDRI